MIGIAFVEDPGATFRVDSPITVRGSEYVRDMVNKLLASVVRKVFLEMWVLPSWRTFFMPLMTPKLEVGGGFCFVRWICFLLCVRSIGGASDCWCLN